MRDIKHGCPAPLSRQLSSAQFHAAVSLSQLHIMIFDDDPASRAELRDALKSAGGPYITEVFNRGRACGGEVSFPSSLDVIISNTQFDSGSGLALLKAIRIGLLADVRPDLCFIFVSDCADAAVVRMAAQLDANGYLIKPFLYSSLRATVLRGFEKPVTGPQLKYANCLLH